MTDSLFNAEQIEQMLRREWWANHGHALPDLYGDDGELQCVACPMDFKREPLENLYDHVLITRARQVGTIRGE